MVDLDLASDDYYANLGVAETASDKEIKIAYELNIIQWCDTDTGTGSLRSSFIRTRIWTARMRRKRSALQCTLPDMQNFKIIGEAYAVLSDAEKRKICTFAWMRT